jgi:hypothetical protein
MPSPFPGMDPFLEARWGDVHTSLTTYARDQLQAQLPGDLRARVEEYVHLYAEDSDDTPRFNPDARIVELASAPSSAVAVAEPETAIAAKVITIPIEWEWTERWIQILDSKGDRVVTTIEFLSPGNKHSLAARAEFQAKQQQLLDAGVNLVEIDLLRQGGWTMSVPENLVPDVCAYPYRTMVLRAARRVRADCYQLPLREPLPRIYIPLRSNDRDIVLDLQQLIHEAWERGRYSDIDYLRARRPPFNNLDEEWIRDRIARWAEQQKTPLA